MAYSLGLGLHVMGHHQPAAVDLFVDIGREPIDLADCPVVHVRLPDLGANLPCDVPDHVNMVADQLNGPTCWTFSLPKSTTPGSKDASNDIFS